TTFRDSLFEKTLIVYSYSTQRFQQVHSRLQRLVNVQSHELQQLVVVHFGEQPFGAFDHVADEIGFSGDQGVDSLLDGPPADELVDQDVAFLADAKRSVSRLIFHG